MLSYLVNCSAIWLLAIVVFDTCLKNREHHAYSRTFLLASLLLGLATPLLAIGWQLPVTDILPSRQYVVPAIPSHANFSGSAFPEPKPVSKQIPWLLILYLSGVVVAFVLLVLDVARLVHWYHKGRRRAYGDWRLVETGRKHGPFSFACFLFVANIQTYTEDELAMVLAHEGRHRALVHLADVLLLQLLKVLFWFHPLIYIFSKRLLMVHEFQADAAVFDPSYRKFLIDQCLLASGPAVASSFGRSPAQRRIAMMQHTAKRSIGVRILVLPLVSVLAVACFSRHSDLGRFRQEGNSFTLEGTIISQTDPIYETVRIAEDVPGDTSVSVITFPPQVAKVNGRHLLAMDFTSGNLSEDVLKQSKQMSRLREVLIEALRPLLRKLDDGLYDLTPGKLTIDEQGRLAYFEWEGGIRKRGSTWPGATTAQVNETRKIDALLKTQIDEKLLDVFVHCPSFDVLYNDGKPVPYQLGTLAVSVSDHKVGAEILGK